MMKRLKTTCFALSPVFWVLLYAASCEDGSNQDNEPPDSETNTSDTDTTSDPDCQPGGSAAQEPCSLDNLCDCNNVCGFQIFNEQNDGGDVLGSYCFAKCDINNPTCAGQSDVCHPLPDKPAVCLPTGAIQTDFWEMKIFAAGTKVKVKDLTLKLNIDAEFAGQSLPENNGSYGMVGKQGNWISLYITMSNQALDDVWILQITVNKAVWKSGSIPLGGDVRANLTHAVSGEDGKARWWLEGIGSAGTLTITRAGDVCTSDENCQTAQGSLTLDLLGSKFEIAPQ